MQTMHLVLPVGSFDWHPTPELEAESRRRMSAVHEIMAAKDWAGLIVFGDIPDPGILSYLTNFSPRLRAAMALIPRDGAPRILSFDGGRMIPAGQETTWVEDVRPAAEISETLGEWLAETGIEGNLALCGFQEMPADIFENLETVTALAGAQDATADLRDMARRKSPGEIGLIRSACEILDAACDVVKQKHESGAAATDCVLAGESEARRSGAQDARCLFSLDGGATFVPFQNSSEQIVDPLIAYLAVKAEGYWADGFIRVASEVSAIEDDAWRALRSMISVARPGASASDLTAAGEEFIGTYARHPLVGESLGNGIGVSLETPPTLDGQADGSLRSGDVVSLKLGLGDGASGHALVSAMVHIGEDGSDVLWSADPEDNHQ